MIPTIVLQEFCYILYLDWLGDRDGIISTEVNPHYEGAFFFFFPITPEAVTICTVTDLSLLKFSLAHIHTTHTKNYRKFNQLHTFHHQFYSMDEQFEA